MPLEDLISTSTIDSCSYQDDDREAKDEEDYNEQSARLRVFTMPTVSYKQGDDIFCVCLTLAKVYTLQGYEILLLLNKLKKMESYREEKLLPLTLLSTEKILKPFQLNGGKTTRM